MKAQTEMPIEQAAEVRELSCCSSLREEERCRRLRREHSRVRLYLTRKGKEREGLQIKDFQNLLGHLKNVGIKYTQTKFHGLICFNPRYRKVSNSFGSPVTDNITLHTQTSSRITLCCESEDSRSDRLLDTPHPQSGRVRGVQSSRLHHTARTHPHSAQPRASSAGVMTSLKRPKHSKNKFRISFNPVSPVERVCHAHGSSCFRESCIEATGGARNVLINKPAIPHIDLNV